MPVEPAAHAVDITVRYSVPHRLPAKGAGAEDAPHHPQPDVSQEYSHEAGDHSEERSHVALNDKHGHEDAGEVLENKGGQNNADEQQQRAVSGIENRSYQFFHEHMMEDAAVSAK